MKKNTSLTIIRSLLILLFLYASFSKIFDVEQFKRSMLNQPFPLWMSYALMFFVPASEIYISFLLLNEKTYPKGLKGSVILMSLFTIYIAIVLLHVFKYVPCSCGGVIKLLSWPQHLIFNIFFLILSIAGIILYNYPSHKQISQSRHIPA